MKNPIVETTARFPPVMSFKCSSPTTIPVEPPPSRLIAQLKYYDATEFPLYGKATKNTENRDKHPRTPIIFIEDPVFAHALFDKKIAIEINKKNKAVNSVFKSLKTNKEVLK